MLPVNILVDSTSYFPHTGILMPNIHTYIEYNNTQIYTHLFAVFILHFPNVYCPIP